MRATITIYTCSICGKESKSVEDMAEYTLSGADGSERHYDVCTACQDTEPWLEVIQLGEVVTKPRAKLGRPPKAKTAPAPVQAPKAVAPAPVGEFDCGVGDCPRRDFKSLVAVTLHRSKAHGVKGAAATKKAAKAARG